MKPLLVADLMLMSVTLIWGMNFPIMKSLYRYFDPLAFTALRFVVAVITLWITLRLLRNPLAIERRDLVPIIGLGILANTVYQLFFVIGLAHTKAGNTGLFMSSTPIFAYLTGVWLRREKFHKAVLSGIVLSALGVCLVVFLGAGNLDFRATWRGDALVLLAVFCWGTYTGAAVRLILKYGALRLTFWVTLTGTIALIPILAPSVLSQDWSRIPPAGWLGFCYSTFLSLVYAYLAWSFALQHLGIARTAVYSNITPLIALVGSWSLLGERPVWAQGFGVLLILTGVFIVRARSSATALWRSGMRFWETGSNRGSHR